MRINIYKRAAPIVDVLAEAQTVQPRRANVRVARKYWLFATTGRRRERGVAARKRNAPGIRGPSFLFPCRRGEQCRGNSVARALPVSLRDKQLSLCV